MSANPGSSEGASGMNQASKAQVFHDVVRKLAAGEHLDPALLTRFANAQNDGVRTGPKPGEKAPDFVLPDYKGQQHSLRGLMGANGLLLVFVRSADW
jgi:hypothetical protein